MKTKIIDTNIPWIPDGFTLGNNKSLGKLTWNLTRVKLWLSEEQKSGYVEGENLKDLVPNPLTSSVLKFLLDNPKEIPEEWKEKYIFFWGTILRNPHGRRYVLYLYWNDGQWHWYYNWLDRDWDVSNPSAVLASSKSLRIMNSSDSLSSELEKAIELVKKEGYKIFKEI